jgi:hypothetical protein
LYQHALTLNAKQANNGGMMNKEKYNQIRTAILRHHLGEKSYVIKKDNNPLFYAWIKKYDSTIKTTPYQLAFGQLPRVGISGFLLDR